MSSNNRSSGARPLLYPPELVEEMQHYNAGLTPVGASRSRASRGRDSIRGVNRGHGSGTAPGRPSPGGTGARSGHGGFGMLRDNTVESPNSHPISGIRNVSANNLTSRPPRRATNNPWASAVLASNPERPAMYNPAAANAVPQSATTSWGVPSAPQIGNKWGITSPAGNPSGFTSEGGFATQHPQAPSPMPLQNQDNERQLPNVVPADSGRVRIVTNWGPDPVGPFCPGHLSQPSAYDAIIEIAQMSGKREFTGFFISHTISHCHCVQLSKK